MRASITLITFGLASFASARLYLHHPVKRQNSCATVTDTCSKSGNGNVYRYCEDYLDVKPIRTTTRTTLSTYVAVHRCLPRVGVTDFCSVTVTTETTATTVTTDICPTHGGPNNSKRGLITMLQKRDPAPTAAMGYGYPLHGLEMRQAAPPKCLSQFADGPQRSSACNCYTYPITTSTKTVHRTTTLPGAPTKYKYTRTVTLTTIQPSPTCDVVSTNKKGKKTNWSEFYGVCNGLRGGGNYPEDDGYVYPADTPLCEALNRCANDVM